MASEHRPSEQKAALLTLAGELERLAHWARGQATGEWEYCNCGIEPPHSPAEHNRLVILDKRA